MFVCFFISQSNPFFKPESTLTSPLFFSLSPKNSLWCSQSENINYSFPPLFFLLPPTSPFLPFMEKDRDTDNSSQLIRFSHCTVKPQSSRKVVNIKMTLPEFFIGRGCERYNMCQTPMCQNKLYLCAYPLPPTSLGCFGQIEIPVSFIYLCQNSSLSFLQTLEAENGKTP